VVLLWDNFVALLTDVYRAVRRAAKRLGRIQKTLLIRV
jgi:hypothetical protein